LAEAVKHAIRWIAPIVIALAGCAPRSDVATPVAAATSCESAYFCDGFETDVVGRLPGAPWREETYGTGAIIRVTEDRAFSGKQSLHVLAPKDAKRRGYVAIHDAPVFPAARSSMYGRAMIWLDAAPIATNGGDSVHWTLLQGEGRSADDRYNAIYRLGGQFDSGLRLKSNYETTPPVRSDCRQHSARTLPVGRWTCVEWHFDGAANEMQYWLDGEELTDIHVIARGAAADSNCAHQEDLQGQWLAPPAFQSLYMGFERYDVSSNDQNLWIDDVVISSARVSCPTGIPRT
jgi:hypothetical protein